MCFISERDSLCVRYLTSYRFLVGGIDFPRCFVEGGKRQCLGA